MDTARQTEGDGKPRGRRNDTRVPVRLRPAKEPGAGEKVAALHDVLLATETTADAVIYVGDDLPDLGPMKSAAFPVAVANAHPAVKQASAYVTRRGGGAGAVAEVVEFILRKQGGWAEALARESGVT